MVWLWRTAGLMLLVPAVGYALSRLAPRWGFVAFALFVPMLCSFAIACVYAARAARLRQSADDYGEAERRFRLLRAASDHPLIFALILSCGTFALFLALILAHKH